MTPRTPRRSLLQTSPQTTYLFSPLCDLCVSSHPHSKDGGGSAVRLSHTLFLFDARHPRTPLRRDTALPSHAHEPFFCFCVEHKKEHKRKRKSRLATYWYPYAYRCRVKKKEKKCDPVLGPLLTPYPTIIFAAFLWRTCRGVVGTLKSRPSYP